jgi:PadR family transcriptional regulator PadR
VDRRTARLMLAGGSTRACEASARSRLLIGRYLPIIPRVPRRKPGTLLPLETEILEVALSMLRSGHATFHGFGLAQTMREQSGSRSLTAHGTLYKALSRLEEFGLLTSQWEDAAAVEGRPRRRLYELTSQGARVAERALAHNAAGRPRRLASELA